MLDKIFSGCLTSFCIGTLQFYCEFGRYLCPILLQTSVAERRHHHSSALQQKKLHGLIRPVMYALKLGKLDIQIVDVAENLRATLVISISWP